MQQQQTLSPSTRAYAHHYFKSFVQFPCYLPCSKRTILASLIPKPLHLTLWCLNEHFIKVHRDNLALTLEVSIYKSRNPICFLKHVLKLLCTIGNKSSETKPDPVETQPVYISLIMTYQLGHTNLRSQCSGVLFRSVPSSWYYFFSFLQQNVLCLSHLSPILQHVYFSISHHNYKFCVI